MTFDTSPYAPEPNGWLRVAAQHHGRATLRFQDPAGSVEGDAELAFDETGEVRIEVQLDPSSLQEEDGNSGGILPFVWPGRSWMSGGQKITARSFGDRLNPCSRLEIETPEGVLATEDDNYYGPHVIMGDGKDGIILTFERSRVAFDVVGAREPRYWAMPLLNFVSAFPQSSPATDRHPLRVYPTPVVPEYLPVGEREAALEAANEKNGLILFEFEGKPGFVERLPDYEEREHALKGGRTRSAATGVIVGEVGDREPTDLENEFPSDVAGLLGLATGSEVSAPGVEFRDEEGRLVRRVHYRLSPAPYLEGHRLLHDTLVPPGSSSPRATGLLLTKATSSPRNGFREGFLRVAMKHLVRAGSDTRTIDEQITYLCRCLDGLCKRFGVDRQNLRDSLSKQEVDDVADALEAAKRAIQPLADNARAGSRPDAARVLNRIAERARQASNVEKQFGLAVADLLRLPRIGLPDADIVDSYYASNPHADGTRTWTGVISKYRGDVIHQGYFPFSEGDRDVEDVLRVAMHLHDVTSRVIFKILGYDGLYRSRVSSSTQKVNWVSTATPPSALGYR
jgi:hypothetical protein